MQPQWLVADLEFESWVSRAYKLYGYEYKYGYADKEKFQQLGYVYGTNTMIKII